MIKNNRTLEILIFTCLFGVGSSVLYGCRGRPSPLAPAATATVPLVTHTPTSEPTASTNDPIPTASFRIPELPVTVTFPGNYTLIKNNEPHRRGSFASYDFSQTGVFTPSDDPYFPSKPPYFYEIQFFSEESIRDFLANCLTGSICFEGDYPDLARYYGQEEAFKQLKDYQNFRLRKFGDAYYFVSQYRCVGAGCAIREYTTFLNDIKIDVWIMMEDESQSDQSDELFPLFKIEG